MRYWLTLIIFLLAVSGAWAMDVEVAVSSVKVDIGLPYSPENLLDGDTSTAWVGGGIGPGIGQWIDLTFDMPTRVYKLGIFNGHQGPGQFEKHRRIRSGRVVYPDGTETQFWLRDVPGEQLVGCSGRPYKSLRIVVDDVFPEGEVLAKIKLAVSEIKLYISLMARPDAAGDGTQQAMHTASPPPVPQGAEVPDGIVELLREFYVRHTTLDSGYAQLFAENVRDKNDFRFEVFRSIQRQRGTFKLLRTARVDTSGLGFELIQREEQFAEVRVFGSYRVQVADIDTNLEEDSVFVVTEEFDGWKIVELDGEEEW